MYLFFFLVVVLVDKIRVDTFPEEQKYFLSHDFIIGDNFI